MSLVNQGKPSRKRSVYGHNTEVNEAWVVKTVKKVAKK